MIEIKKKIFSEEDIQSFINLSKSDNLRSEGMKDPKIVSWKFILNPMGASNYFFFEVKNKILGRILSAHFPGKIAIKKKIHNSYCLSDLYIDKNYRNLSYLKSLYLTCLKETNGVIFHSSNENSEKFYTKILNKKIFFNLESIGLPLSNNPFKKYSLIVKSLFIFYKIYLLFLKFFNFLLIFNRNIKIETSNEAIFDKEIENLKEFNFQNEECFFLKNNDFFKWRYKNYKKIFLLKIYSKKKFIGYVILIESFVLNLSNMILIDFQFSRKMSFIERLKLKFKILEICQNNKCDTFFTFGNKQNFMYKNLLGFPFLNLPDRILPHSNPMFIHNFNKGDEEFLEKINFTISDFDYF